MTANDPTPTAPISAAAALVGDPAQWGHVGEDGTVFVRTPEGDRAVGTRDGRRSPRCSGEGAPPHRLAPVGAARRGGGALASGRTPQAAAHAARRWRSGAPRRRGAGGHLPPLAPFAGQCGAGRRGGDIRSQRRAA